MKKILLPIVFILLASVSFAQSSDRVILVSDTTSVDLLIAKAAGEKTGVPVLVLQGGALDGATRDQLVDLGVKTVFLVGGPAVIAPEIETELQVKYTVVRLWGYERTGTAVAVAKHFWNDGAPCAVVADDTKNSDADTNVQTEATEEASDNGCPFFPVPKGTIPAEVLDVLGSLNTTNATFVGTSANGEFRAKLAKLHIREIVGDIKKIESDVETGKNASRLLIIAAPNWKHVLGFGGHGGKYNIVRITSSVDSVPALVELINARNITDVRVLGEPALAAQIAAQLNASGIIVTKISGSNAAEVSRAALNKTADDWEEKRQEAVGHELQARSRIRVALLHRLDTLDDRLDVLKTELADLSASGADPQRIGQLEAKINATQAQISVIKNFIDNGNMDTASIRIGKVLGEIESLRWLHRNALSVKSSDEVATEEGSVEQTTRAADLSSLKTRLAAIKEKCGSDAVANLTERARTLKQEVDNAVAAGDNVTAAMLAIGLRNIAMQAMHIGSVCERIGKISPDLEGATTQSIEHVGMIRTTTATP